MLETLTSVFPTDYNILKSIGTELRIKGIRALPRTDTKIGKAVGVLDWVDQLWKKPLKMIFIRQKGVRGVLASLNKLGGETKANMELMLPNIERNYSIIHQESKLLRETLQLYKGKFNYDAIKSNLDQLARLYNEEKEITASIRDRITLYTKTTKGALKSIKKGYLKFEDYMCAKHRVIYIILSLSGGFGYLTVCFYLTPGFIFVSRLFTQIIVQYNLFSKLKYYSAETKQEVEAELEPILEPESKPAKEPVLTGA